jgi:hypothetical protein
VLEWTGGVAKGGKARHRADPEAANAVVLGLELRLGRIRTVVTMGGAA